VKSSGAYEEAQRRSLTDHAPGGQLRSLVPMGKRRRQPRGPWMSCGWLSAVRGRWLQHYRSQHHVVRRRCYRGEREMYAGDTESSGERARPPETRWRDSTRTRRGAHVCMVPEGGGAGETCSRGRISCCCASLNPSPLSCFLAFNARGPRGVERGARARRRDATRRAPAAAREACRAGSGRHATRGEAQIFTRAADTLRGAPAGAARFNSSAPPRYQEAVVSEGFQRLAPAPASRTLVCGMRGGRRRREKTRRAPRKS